jgi:hypothetical protein
LIQISTGRGTLHHVRRRSEAYVVAHETTPRISTLENVIHFTPKIPIATALTVQVVLEFVNLAFEVHVSATFTLGL